jgi:endoglucanase
MKIFFVLFFFSFSVVSIGYSQQSLFVTTKGKDVVTPNGKPLLLRGINIGNWLVPEGYMFKFKHSNSPQRINETFSQLLGPEETKKFWKQYRDNYVTKEDITFIKKSGLNSIRVQKITKLDLPVRDLKCLIV